MLTGSVSFSARFKGRGIKFDLTECKSNTAQIEKAVIECADGTVISCSIHLLSVSSPDEGRAIASEEFAKILDRIAFAFEVAIGNAICSGDQFGPIDRPNRTVRVDSTLLWNVLAQPTVVSESLLKDLLENATLSGENKYGLFRAARESGTPVEEFMHLYHILLMIFFDEQKDVDHFIVSQEPLVSQSPHPVRKRNETIYTRLRNEFAHQRPGVQLSDTKSQMAKQIKGLVTLTKKAIERSS